MSANLDIFQVSGQVYVSVSDPDNAGDVIALTLADYLAGHLMTYHPDPDDSESMVPDLVLPDNVVPLI